MNETLSNLMTNGSIPLDVTVRNTTNWIQFATTVAIGLLSIFGVFLVLYAPTIMSWLKFGGSLRKISKITKRNVVMIKHTRQELFSQSMINEKTLRDLAGIMNKMEGEPFDLILHTPGGDIFSSLAVSRFIKQYPGQIRAIIPLYSMSGGSLLALSCKELIMAPNACLGPIDPQLGSFFKYGSAKAWDHIVKFKGKKAEDQSISFAMMGQQYTKSIAAHLNNIIDFGLTTAQKGKLIEFLTDGSIEHAYPLIVTDLQRFGISINVLSSKDEKFTDALSKLISSKGKEGVTYYKIPKHWWNKNGQL